MASEPLDFSQRAHLPEWMDEPCSYEDFRDCLRNLEQVNRTVLAYRPTLQWLQQFAGTSETPLYIVDVGCGGGDMLRRVERWARTHGVQVKLTGIDLNPYSARAAREFTPAGSRIQWITGDAISYQPSTPVDLVLSSHLTHHLQDEEIVHFLQWMERVTMRGWFINDLHRERMPYYGFRALSWAMRWHRFIRHDGPVSIRRSFSPSDWERYCAAAGLDLKQVQITKVKPARLCVARTK